MKLLILLVSLFCNINQILAADKSPVQLLVDQINAAITNAPDQVNNMQQGWQKRIDAVSAAVGSLTASDQTSANAQLKKLQNVIQKQTSNASQALKTTSDNARASVTTITNAVNQKTISDSAARSQLNVVLAQLQSTLSTILKTMQSAVEPGVLNVESLVAKVSQQQQVKQQTQQAQQNQEKQAAYKEKVSQLLKGLATQLPQFDAVNKDATALLLSYLSGSFLDVKKMFALTKRYEQVLKNLFGVYTQIGFTIDFADRSNNVTNALRRLIDLYARDLAITQNKAEAAYKKRDREQYHKLLAGLVDRMVGTGQDSLFLKDGYGAVINDLATRYIQVNAPQALTSYQTIQTQMILNTYPDALQDLINSGNVNSTYLTYALAYYKAIKSVVNLVPTDQAQSLQQLADANMGVLYATQADQALKFMGAGKNNKTLFDQAFKNYQQAVVYFTQAQQTADIQRYQSVVNFLQQAVSERQQAQNAQNQTDKTTAINLYQKAYKDFLAANDMVDAQEMNVLYHRLQGSYAVQQAQQALQSFITQNKSQWQAYAMVISTAQ